MAELKELKIEEITAVCEDLGLNKKRRLEKGKSDFFEEDPKEKKERLKSWHYSNLTADAIQKKLVTLEKKIAAGQKSSTDNKKKARYEKVLSILKEQNGKLLQAVSRENMDAYRSMLVSDYAMKKKDKPDELLILDLDESYYNIFTHEEILQIISRQNKEPNGSTERLIPSDYLKMMLEIYQGENVAIYNKLFQEICTEKGKGHLWESGNYERAKELIKTKYNSAKKKKLQNMDAPEYEVLYKWHSDLIPLLDQDAHRKDAAYNKAILIIAEYPGSVKILGKRDITEKLELQEIQSSLDALEKNLKIDRGEAENILRSVAPYLNIYLPKMQQENTVPINLTDVSNYIAHRGKNYRSALQTSLNKAREVLNDKNTYIEKAETYLDEAYHSLGAWKGIHNVMRSYDPSQISVHFPNYESILAEIETDIHSCERRYDEIKEAFDSEQHYKKECIGELNERQHFFEQECRRLPELKDYVMGLFKKSSKKKGKEYSRLIEQRDFLHGMIEEYQVICQRIEYLEVRYQGNGSYKDISTKNQKNWLELKSLLNYVNMMLKEIEEAKKRRSFVKIFIILMIISVCITYGGKIISPVLKAYEANKLVGEIKSEGVSAVVELAENSYSEEFSKFISEINVHLEGSELSDSISDLEIGTTEGTLLEKTTPISFRFDDGVVNARVKGVIQQQAGNVFVEYDEVKIEGIDIIGQWVWENDFNMSTNIISVTFDSYDPETGELTGGILLDTNMSDSEVPVDVIGRLDKENGILEFTYTENLRYLLVSYDAQTVKCKYDPQKRAFVDRDGYAWVKGK